MAGVLRLFPRLQRITPVITSRCVSISVTRDIMTQNFNRPGKAFAARAKLLETNGGLLQNVRFMSADPDNEEEIRDRVLYCLKCYDKIDPEKLTVESHFMKDLGLDSLDHVEIIVAIENEFSLEIPDSKAELLLTPQEIIAYICDDNDIDE